MRLDRESADLRAREAEDWAAAREDARARKAQEATCCWEANQERLAMAQAAQQAAQEDARQAFQLAMLKVMANMGGGRDT